MKLGIVGLPQSGKSTIFAALTGARGEENDQASSRNDTRIATITVHDKRIDFLSSLYHPKKINHAKVEYLLPSEILSSPSAKSERSTLNQARVCDALVHIVRNFKGPGGIDPEPEQDFCRLEDEMILSDLVVAEKRIERIELDRKRGRKDGEEYPLLKSCIELLENGQALRNVPELASKPLLKGFTFLSAKPMLVIINNDDENEELPAWHKMPESVEMLVVRGRLEMDIASMLPEEAEEFLEAYHIQESVLDRIIKSSYSLLNRISFFTVGPDEVKAWPVSSGTEAVDAAGVIHSDIKQGFIRAEVFSYQDLIDQGSFQAAKKAGLVRLEGKKYVVKDGDIINFRFNV